MTYEAQLRFIKWKEDILRRCEEFVDARHAETLKKPNNVKITSKGNTFVTVKPMDGMGEDGWVVSKNGIAMQSFLGKNAQRDATIYADKILNGPPLLSEKSEIDKTKSGEGYYDRGKVNIGAFSVPERCLFCGGYFSHREKCPGEPKLGPDQEPSGAK